MDQNGLQNGVYEPKNTFFLLNWGVTPPPFADNIFGKKLLADLGG